MQIQITFLHNIFLNLFFFWWKDHLICLQGQNLLHQAKNSKMCWSPRGSLQPKKHNFVVYIEKLITVIMIKHYHLKTIYKMINYLGILWFGNVLSGFKNDIQNEECQEEAGKVAKCQKHNKPLCHAHNWNGHPCNWHVVRYTWVKSLTRYNCLYFESMNYALREH